MVVQSSRNSSSPISSPRCLPILIIFTLFALLFLLNLDNFIARTRAIARQSYNEQTRLFMNAEAGTLNKDFEITWGEARAKIHNNGGLLTLSMDKASGSGFRSQNQYLFGKIEMQVKLVTGNSAGTVTTYYLSSDEGPIHDEIDFEFLGNETGDPYTLHTNVYCHGTGNREQQFFLWFDPTTDFHTYSILWNPFRIIFSVDGTPIREFKNMEKLGVPFPMKLPMRVYSSIWNGEDWATKGGRVKTDWTKAPFTASYRNYKANACLWTLGGSSSCHTRASPRPSNSSNQYGWKRESLNATGLERMKWVRDKYMVYDYCKDEMRFPEGFPRECSLSSS